MFSKLHLVALLILLESISAMGYFIRMHRNNGVIDHKDRECQRRRAQYEGEEYKTTNCPYGSYRDDCEKSVCFGALKESCLLRDCAGLTTCCKTPTHIQQSYICTRIDECDEPREGGDNKFSGIGRYSANSISF